ncbi:hypothetical protein [Bradyrhizobium sp.]|jgi:hypothetical protein|uniref:hypothetical protein n=1 Tax=Bradyrhizobium sp. TaxID=376 RepID=UPI002E061356|nr:hypothetical protein [Bradyrhizobium sp.]
MIGMRELIDAAQSWSRQDYLEWLSSGFFELADPSEDGLPFHPLFIVPTQEPLGQLHQAVKLAPGRIRGAIHAALRDLLSALTPERSARYCDLAWRLAAGLRPPGGLTDQARHLLSFPEVEEPVWLECVRSVLRAVLGYAKTPEIEEFIEDFRASRHWRHEFAWSYGQYIARRDARRWLEFMKAFESDLSADREASPSGYRRRLRALACAVGAAHIAPQYMAMQESGVPWFLFEDLTAEPDPIMRLKHGGLVLGIAVGSTRAELTSPMEADDSVRLKLFKTIGDSFGGHAEAERVLFERAKHIPGWPTARPAAQGQSN